MAYQLRYLGPGEPDPETLVDDRLEAAIRTVQRRLDRGDVTGIVLLSEGHVVRTFAQNEDPVGLVDDQILASAGIYRLGESRSPAGDQVRRTGRSPARRDGTLDERTPLPSRRPDDRV